MWTNINNPFFLYSSQDKPKSSSRKLTNTRSFIAVRHQNHPDPGPGPSPGGSVPRRRGATTKSEKSSEVEVGESERQNVKSERRYETQTNDASLRRFHSRTRSKFTDFKPAPHGTDFRDLCLSYHIRINFSFLKCFVSELKYELRSFFLHVTLIFLRTL